MIEDSELETELLMIFLHATAVHLLPWASEPSFAQKTKRAGTISTTQFHTRQHLVTHFTEQSRVLEGFFSGSQVACPHAPLFFRTKIYGTVTRT
jgi:hypothetical protein